MVVQTSETHTIIDTTNALCYLTTTIRAVALIVNEKKSSLNILFKSSALFYFILSYHVCMCVCKYVYMYIC